MARSCPACGRANDDDASFCQGCGATLAGPDARPVSAPRADVTRLRPASRLRRLRRSGGRRSRAAFRSRGAGDARRARATRTARVASAGRGPARRRTAAPRQAGAQVARDAHRRGGDRARRVLIFVLFPRGGGNDDGPIGADADHRRHRRRLSAAPSRPVPRRRRRSQGRPARGDHGDGTVEPITRFSGEQIWQIAYSPDGKWLACIAGTYKRSEVWLFDGGERRRTAGDGRRRPASSPSTASRGSRTDRAPGGRATRSRPRPPARTPTSSSTTSARRTSRRWSTRGGLALRGVAVSASQRRRTGSPSSPTRTVKTDKYGMVTAKERLELLERASGVVTAARREQGALRRQRPRLRRAADLPERRGDHLPPRRQRRRHELHGRRRRRQHADAGPRDAVPGRLRLGPGRHEGRLHRSLPQAVRRRQAASGRPSSGSSTPGPAPRRCVARYKDTMVQDLSWSPDGKTIAWAEYDQEKYQTGTVYLTARGRRRLEAARPGGSVARVGAGGAPARCRRRRALDGAAAGRHARPLDRAAVHKQDLSCPLSLVPLHSNSTVYTLPSSTMDVRRTAPRAARPRQKDRSPR